MIAHSELNGNCNITDWVQRYVRTCLRVNAFPRIDVSPKHALDWVSVTYCAQAIVTITTKLLAKAVEVKAVHLINGSGKTDLNSIPAGSGLPIVSHAEWLERVKALPAEENPIVSLLGLFIEGFPSIETNWQCEAANSLLHGSVVAKPIDAVPLLRYLKRE